MTEKTPHPLFDDKGSLHWHTELNDALRDARAQGKRVFIEMSRESCAACRTLTEGVIPIVAPLLEQGFVALASDADETEEEVDELADKLDGALELPILIVTDASGQYLGGLTGQVDHAQLTQLLEETKIDAD